MTIWNFHHERYQKRIRGKYFSTSLTRARKIKSIIDMVRKEIAKSERKENELELRFKQFCKRNNINPDTYGLK